MDANGTVMLGSTKREVDSCRNTWEIAGLLFEARKLAEEWRNFAEEIRTAVCGMGDDDWPLLPPPDGLPWEEK